MVRRYGYSRTDGTASHSAYTLKICSRLLALIRQEEEENGLIGGYLNRRHAFLTTLVLILSEPVTVLLHKVNLLNNTTQTEFERQQWEIGHLCVHIASEFIENLEWKIQNWDYCHSMRERSRDPSYSPLFSFRRRTVQIPVVPKKV